MCETHIRPPAVAGQFYPDAPDLLRRMIGEAFHAALGPGELPAVGAGPRRLLGIVSPHAGYPYSGAGTAWGLAAAARDGRPAAVVILGVNHRGLGEAVALSPALGWATPLGVMPVAQALGAALRVRVPELHFDAAAHALEHSLEVLVPFLQVVFGEIPIVPIALGAIHEATAQTLGEALAELATTHELLIVASSDFSHYVSHAEAARLDWMVLERIAAVDPGGVLRTVREWEITMCGVWPVVVALVAAQRLRCTGEILHYHTSGEVSGDRSAVVGYGTAAIWRPGD
jgi:AmmeMemoRadiSam system protein B